jgi:hypothetical protein
MSAAPSPVNGDFSNFVMICWIRETAGWAADGLRCEVMVGGGVR